MTGTGGVRSARGRHVRVPGPWGVARHLVGEGVRAVVAGSMVAGVIVAAVTASPYEVSGPTTGDRDVVAAAGGGGADPGGALPDRGATGSAGALSTGSLAALTADRVVRRAPVPDPLPGPGQGQALPAEAVRPTAVRVPALGVDAPLDLLGISPDGTIEVPADAARAGWLTTSRTPGSPGPAVIAGHVDSRQGPGVFARLRELGPGETILVQLDDGRVEQFVVTHVRQYAKEEFPTAEVYGGSPAPALRVITCGGSFDRATGHYQDNVVVYAVLDG